MISLAFLLPAVLMSGATITVLEPVNGDCKGEVWSRGDLHVLHYTAGQSCPPGGPCSVSGVADLPLAGVRLRIDGCQLPLPGTFEETGRRCRGARLRRFTGRIPAGAQLVLQAPHTSYGTFQAPGTPGPVRCPGVTGKSRTVEVPQRPQNIWTQVPDQLDYALPPGQIQVTPAGDGFYTVRIPVPAYWSDTVVETRMKADSAGAVLAQAERDPQGNIRLKGEARVTYTDTGRKNGACQRSTHWILTVIVQGTAITALGEGGGGPIQLEQDQCPELVKALAE
ncbi:MAG: hypothetical protein R3F43_10240 [bacterium]